MASRRSGSLGLLGRRRRLRLRRRVGAPRRPARPPRSAAAEQEPDAWRDYAAAFVAAGLVAAPPPPEEEEPERGERPALAAVEAKESGAVLLLPQGQTLTFTGKCFLTCLYGSVQVFGFNIAQDQPPYSLFSPHSHCALTIEAVAYKELDKSKKEKRTEAKAILKAHRVPQEARCRLMKSFAPQCSVVLLEHLDTPGTRFILSHSCFSHIFRAKRNKTPSFTPEDAVLASTGVGRQDPGSGLLMSDSALSAVEELIQVCQEEDENCPVILVCGSKSVGKSTFNRYLINLLLNRLPCIEFLECDLGQPEFTPPGCVSLINVTEPLLGPPFTHQRTPRKMVYFGETSCEQDTERYIDTLKYVFSAYERDVPLLINTMGWVKGAGLLLLVDIIRLLSPSHLVQISAQDFTDMPTLSPEYIRCAAGLHTRGKVAPRCKNLGSGLGDLEPCRGQGDSLPPHKLLCVQPQFPGAGVAGDGRTHSSVLRDMAVLGYLGQLQPPEVDPVLPLHSLVPYQVPFNAVALKVIHADVAPAHILYSLNASWVGLCRIPDEVRGKSDGPVVLTQTPICDCLGFGIVRGIDMDKKRYYILTPVAPENLRRVNCLLIGSIPIPNCIFLNQPGIEGEIPYVTSQYNYDISGAGKLKLKKHLKRREHNQP
ncbi:polynucleotide 5'-hydroxyl-kinase NOL9 [Hemicordylus capensis]|uniref:polynucleotide 5'-hydroxyl-kinase NOL9 n=1 Tax=Hemicordylus capensis TaxID=884348 RepID=UPI00230383BC|nr:polynucleotide 5'-hydroxyl-kinase NOL9 [Hemicordylus capensis]